MSVYPRTNYEMTQSDLDVILDACRPVPYIVIGGHVPSSPQENANRAWAALGEKMGFDYMTVQPGNGDRLFSAVPSETKEQRKEREDREAIEHNLREIQRLEGEIQALQEQLEDLQAKRGVAQAGAK